MASDKDATMESGRAFTHRSVLGIILKIGIGLGLAAGLTLLVLALFFKDQWTGLRNWTADTVMDTRVSLFEHLSLKFVNASDLRDEDKEDWRGLIAGMSTAMRNEHGSDEQLKSLRGYFDIIAEAMKDKELSSAELEPHRSGLSQLLTEIDGNEKIKQG